MASVSFHLKDPNAETTTLFIWFNPRNGDPRIRIYTGTKIEPAHWVGGKVQRALVKGKGVDSVTNEAINATNELMSKKLLDLWNTGRAVGVLPTAQQLRDAIEPEAPAPSVEIPLPLADFEAYLERLKKESSPATVKSKRTTYNHLKAFALASNRELQYADFNRQFKDAFATYLAEEVELADSSLNKQLKILKEFLAFAADHGRTPRIDIRGWKWDFAENPPLALTIDELTRIENLQALPPYLENARGLFLLMCYTGLRYSDAVRLKPEHDKGDHLHLTPKKTRDVAVYIYVRKKLRPLLDSYWAGQIRLISNQKLNEYIKELGKRAEITEPVERIKFYGQTTRPQKASLPKYEYMKCHMGRSTFITHANGIMPIDVIMQATGHRDPKIVLRRYNQATVARQVDVARRAWGEENE